MDICCEEGQKYTGGMCWKHTHREMDYFPELSYYIPETIPAEKFNILIERTRNEK